MRADVELQVLKVIHLKLEEDRVTVLILMLTTDFDLPTRVVQDFTHVVPLAFELAVLDATPDFCQAVLPRFGLVQVPQLDPVLATRALTLITAGAQLTDDTLAGQATDHRIESDHLALSTTDRFRALFVEASECP